MMNNFKLLLKINILQTFNLNVAIHSKDNKEKRKLIFFLGLMLFVGAVMVAYSYIYFSLIAPTLAALNMLDLLIGMMMSMASFLIVFTSLYKVVGLIIGCKDYDMLASLPLKNSTIMISKWVTLYASNLIFILLILAPGIYIYQSYIAVGFGFYAALILCALVLPLLPIVIGCMIGVIIRYFSSRFRHSNFIAIFLMFGAIGAYMYYITSIQSADQLMEIGTTIAKMLNQIYPLTTVFIDAVCNLDIAALAFFIALNVVVFSVFTWLISKYYMSLNTLVVAHTNSNFKLKKTKATGVVMTLVKKEVKRYLASTIYVTNTAMGEVLQLLAVGYLWFQGMDSFEQVLNMGDISSFVAVLFPFFICVTAGIGCTTQVSISMEGKQLWISKSLPISPMQIFIAKMAVFFIIALPIAIIDTIILSIIFKITILQMVVALALVIIFIIFIAMVGIVVNLHFPVFDWQSETRVVKQSMASFIQVMLAMIITVVPVAMIITTGNTNIIYIYLGIITVLSVGLYQYIKTVGTKIFLTL